MRHFLGFRALCEIQKSMRERGSKCATFAQNLDTLVVYLCACENFPESIPLSANKLTSHSFSDLKNKFRKELLLTILTPQGKWRSAKNALFKDLPRIHECGTKT